MDSHSWQVGIAAITALTADVQKYRAINDIILKNATVFP
jgi:hypothetical protein